MREKALETTRPLKLAPLAYGLAVALAMTLTSFGAAYAGGGDSAMESEAGTMSGTGSGVSTTGDGLGGIDNDTGDGPYDDDMGSGSDMGSDMGSGMDDDAGMQPDDAMDEAGGDY